MEWNYRDDLPIYSQLVEQLKQAIVSGALGLGTRLQSVRELATDAGVNPNTMQRALAELEQEGLVFTQRTAGRYVTEDEEVIRRARESLAKKKVGDFVSSMRGLRFNMEEIASMIMKTEEES